MSFLKSLFNKKDLQNKSMPINILDSSELFDLSSSLEKNKKNIEMLFKDCDDFIVRCFQINHKSNALVCYYDSLTSSDQINRYVLEKLMLKSDKNITINNAKKILARFIPVYDVKNTKDTKELILSLYDGDCVVLIDGLSEAMIINVSETKGRLVTEPLVEVSSIGPQEGFVEDVQLNLTLLRKRVKTAKLKVERSVLGRVCKNHIMVAYIDGIVKKNLVDELKMRISHIDTDGFIDSGHLRRFLNENKFSPFPQEIMTERPDRCVNYLLEGRIVVFVDGSPFALIYPSVFIDILKTADEAYIDYYMATFLRVMRFAALGLSTLGSALYIALTVFNPGMIPTELLITIVSSRADIPFPAIFEALLMELTFELLREANTRVPKPIGPSISIVGGLVIGQSVVEAGIASQPMIIIVALTSISSFAVPGFTTGSKLRLLRFFFMFASSALGMYGIISLLLLLLVHMASLRSLGVPYLSPLAPLNIRDIYNNLMHAPATLQKYRPSFLEVQNPVHTSKSSEHIIPKNIGGTE